MSEEIFLSFSDLIVDGTMDDAPIARDGEYVNIVLAADETYYYPMLCVIKSACANKLPSTKYQFMLLVDDDFTKDREREVNSVLRGYGLPAAKVFNRSSEYLDVEYEADHLSRASCYRLQIPSLLKRTEKCIYLDCDTLVRRDLSEFYDMLEDEDLIVAVLAAAYQLNPSNAKAKAELLGLPNIDTYTNSGVMVMNLERMRQTNIEEVFDDMLDRDFPDIDQDILNAACFGHVHVAPPVFNVMTKYSFDEDSYESDPAVKKVWSLEEWEEARTNPVIVHFADTDKPWTDYALPFAKEWWEYIDDMGLTEKVFKFFYDLHAARQSSVYEMRKKVIDADRRFARLRDASAREKEELSGQLESANARIDRQKERIGTQKARIEALRHKLTTQRNKTIEVQKSLKASRTKLKAVKSSKSYKLGRALTKPYRSIKGGKR